jgi:hypothetical protein
MRQSIRFIEYFRVGEFKDEEIPMPGLSRAYTAAAIGSLKAGGRISGNRRDYLAG